MLNDRQPIWAESVADLPPHAPDIYFDRQGFLEEVALWLRHRHESQSTNRTGSIADVLRDHEKVWPGVGVYTSSELCGRAGQ